MFKGIFDEYISEERMVEYQPVQIYCGVITKEQALQDIEQLIYIIDNRYCGKEYWENKGIEFSSCYQEIRDYVLHEEEIYISDYCRAIHRAFDRGIVDNHFAFASPLTGRLGYHKQYNAYFADLLIEKRVDKFYVIKSGYSDIVVGDEVQNEDVLFPTLAPMGKRRYLVGKRSYGELVSMLISVNGIVREVGLHKCRAGKKIEDRDICLYEKERAGIPIIRANCCDFVGNLREHTDIVAIGKRYSSSERLILNYLSNEGGYNRITREFIQGLNGYAHLEEYSAKLISPITEGKDCKRQWIVSDCQTYEYEKAMYKGTLYMLVNSDTASSGESAVLYARSVKNLVLIGENTMGCNTFGNVASYVLGNSGIVCRVPNVVNLCRNPEDCQEGKGFEPDFWVDSTDVEGEVVEWLCGNAEKIS
ncbi:MAG: S41 family peptidase [Muribaculum sp.]|nr:S41 family peptidase [Muribaculum sp.]